MKLKYERAAKLDPPVLAKLKYQRAAKLDPPALAIRMKPDIRIRHQPLSKAVKHNVQQRSQ